MDDPPVDPAVTACIARRLVHAVGPPDEGNAAVYRLAALHDEPPSEFVRRY